MSTTLIVASSNTHKIQEIQGIISHIPFKTLNDFSIKNSPEENGKTFFENAMIKALYYYREIKKQIHNGNIAILSEDSGISIDALNNEPGIYSSRYGEHIVRQEEKNNNPQWQLDFVLHKMQNITNRNAYFTCCAVLLFSEENFLCSQATWQGEILQEKKGAIGFGYDPIFYVPEYKCSSAELNFQQKNNVSHRAKALKKLESTLEC